MAVETSVVRSSGKVLIPRMFGLSTERAVSVRADIEALLQDRTGHINSLNDLTLLPPFVGKPLRDVSAVFDIDGVLTPPDLKNILTLRSLSPYFGEFILYTGRILREGGKSKFNPFPFITKTSVARISHIVHHANPGCDTSGYWLGFSAKQLRRGSDPFVEGVLQRLQNNQKVVIIGSDNVDDHKVRDILRKAGTIDVSNLYYYSTDKALLSSVIETAVGAAQRKIRRVFR